MGTNLVRRLALSLLLLAIPVAVSAQAREITGRVVAETGQAPLADVAVQLVGTQRGAFTDANGRFSITVPAGPVQLRVSLIGWATQTVAIDAGQMNVTINMARDVLNLDEIVVTGQATSVARRNLANAVSTVSADELTKAPAASLEQQLAGKIAGADIQANSGAPGGGLQVNLRGVSSIIGSATPLYVVDGVIVSDISVASGTNVIERASGGSFNSGFASNQDNAPNRIADLNPNDIESVEVLKGASAAAIYGSKANNGVIIITTKRGRSGAPQFSLTQRFGTFDLSNKLGLRRFNSMQEAVDVFGPRAADYWDGNFYDHEEEIAGNNPLSYETALSMSGGTPETRYFASGLVKHDGGIITGTYYDKQSLRLNIDQNLGDRATVRVNMNGLHTKTGRGFTNNDNRSISYWMTFPQTPTFVNIQKDENGDWPDNPFANSNPLQTASLAKNDEQVWRIISSAELQLDLLQGDDQSLRFTGNAGADFFNLKNVVFSPPELQFEPLDGKPGTTYLGQTDNLNLNAGGSLVHEWHPESMGISATTSLGMQYEQRELDVARILNEDLIVGQSNIDQGTNPGIFQNRQKVRDLGFFAQEEVLLLDERLLLTAGLRADRSSNNAEPDKYYYYPKFAGSYRFPDLVPGKVDELKLRAAWGQAGNQPLYGDKFSNLNSGNIAGLQTLNISTTTVAEDLHPERQRELEGGFDATLFNQRAQLEFTAYQRRITELLLRRALPPSSGYNTAIFNGGVMKTTGYEAALQLLPISKPDFEWNSRVTFSKDKTIIEELPVPPFAAGGFGTALGGFRVEEGKSATQIVGRDTTTVVNDPRCDGDCPIGTRIVTGIGDANPDFRMGFSNEIRKGAFSLYSLFDWQHGGDVINLTAWLYDLSQTAGDFADPCNISGCQDGETLGEYRLRVYPGRTSKVWVEDGSFLKLRELTLTYDVPQDLVQGIWGRARFLRLSLSGRNLYTWTGYSGMDPEVSNFGAQAIGRNVDVAPYPPSRSFWLSVDIGF